MMSKAPEVPVTHLLHRWQGGDHQAGELLFRTVADELRQIAGNLFRNERGGHTLQPTAVVNEAFVRLLGLRSVEWQDRAHFYAFAATSMRRVLVDHARSRDAQKRGGEWLRTEMPRGAGAWTDPVEVLAIDDALNALAQVDPERAKLAELRFYSGLTVEEIAELWGVSDRTIKRRWRATKGWLRDRLEGRTNAGGDTE